jgi:hypothetical protein
MKQEILLQKYKSAEKQYIELVEKQKTELREHE